MKKFFRYIWNLFSVKKNSIPHIVSESQVESDNKIREEIVIGYLTQFSLNQNHQQKIFIQFLSSVLVVIIAYVFVYTNTITPNGIKNPLGNTKGILKNEIDKNENHQNFFQDSIIKPNLTSSLKLPSGDIYSYSIKHLLAIYLFSQFVFIVLVSMIINMGYGFRRDLRIIHNIRSKYLGQKDYQEIFGDEHYTWLNKRWYNFLPGFNLNLCFAILILQIMFWISIWDYIRTGDTAFLNSGLYLVKGKAGFIKMNHLIPLLFIPILISIVIYRRYFGVYKKIKITTVEHITKPGNIY